MFFSSKTILIVDDNLDILRLNSKALTKEGFRVYSAGTLKKARQIIADYSIDLIVLDILLPDGSGFDFCKELREKSIVPILFLTNKHSLEDIVNGLCIGGDDYMTKPYQISELIARIRSLLRREEMLKQHNLKTSGQFIECGPIKLDLTRLAAYMDGKDICLTPKEFVLLKILIQNEGKPVATKDLYEAAWIHGGQSHDYRAVWTHMSKLRTKLSSGGDKGIDIRAERGLGYTFERIPL